MKTKKNKMIGLCVAAVVLLGHLSFAERLWPLQLGQTYTYTQSAPSGSNWTVRIDVKGYTTYDSVNYFNIWTHNYENNGKNENWGYVRSTENEFFSNSGQDLLDFQIAPVGTTWVQYDPADEYAYKVIEIVAIEEVTVPYGHFEEAYKHRKYKSDDPNDLLSRRSPDWYEWVVPGMGWVKLEDYYVSGPAPMIMELVEMTQNTDPISITKFTARAGKTAGTDSVQFSGVLGALGLETLLADEIAIRLDADDMAAPLVWKFPINESTFKNGNFNAKTANNSFRYNVKNGRMTFSAKNADLTGLACPMQVTITLGDRSESAELDTAMVNGPKRPCPPQFLMGVRNSLIVDRAQVKFGKKANTDSLTVRGFFTIADTDHDKASPMILRLGEQTFTVSGDQFKANKFSERCNKAVSAEGSRVNGRFDFAKCTFQIQVRNAHITESGTVEIGLNLFGNELSPQSIIVGPLPEGRGDPVDPVLTNEMTWVAINDPGFVGQMSRYETTNAQFAQYLNDALASGDITVSGGYVRGRNGSNPGEDFVNQNYYFLNATGLTDAGATNGGKSRISRSGGRFIVESGFEKHPVTYVSWYGATAFSSYYGWRLPTESQWQAVADFNGSYNYGCGPTIDNSKANYYSSQHPHGTTEVGAFGTYGYGMADMAGNVWEWTSTLSGNYRIVRGGSWYYTEYSSGVAIRLGLYPYNMYYDSGFRVCR